MSRRRGRGTPFALVVLIAALALPATAQAATADLAVDKVDSPDPVASGAVLTYTIQVTNEGPDAAGGVVLTDRLPSQVDFVSATSTQGTCDRDGRNVECSLGTLAADPNNPAATVTITVRPQKAGTLENTASVAVGAGDTDPVPGNNSETVTTIVTGSGGGGGGGGGGPACAGRAADIIGTAASETLIGTPGRDVIVARGGNDLIKGLGGRDIVCARSGADRIRGGAGDDKLKGNRGRDAIRGGSGDDAMSGGPGRDRCRGGSGSNTERSC